MSAQEDANGEFSPGIRQDPYIHDSGSLMPIDAAAATHLGHVRSNNEDHYLVMRVGRSLETLNTNLDSDLLAASYDLTGYGLLVADGLGRMAAGEIAPNKEFVRGFRFHVQMPTAERLGHVRSRVARADQGRGRAPRDRRRGGDRRADAARFRGLAFQRDRSVEQ